MEGTHKWQIRKKTLGKKVREVDDAERELSRLPASIFILEIGWRVNFRFHLYCPTPLREPLPMTGVHTAPDSKDNFYKLVRISVNLL